MCGICGAAGSRTAKINRQSMLQAIAHRGPDDEGIFFEKDIFLGHRRLAILDVSKAGHQPMSYGQYVLVFNGEIYNYVELRQELQKMGQSFVTNTDTEVILHAYAVWGLAAFGRFRGMWALAIYDKKEEKLVLCRDRFGIKPLYYSRIDDSLVFASEIPALLAAGVKAQPNMDTIVRYLALGSSDNNQDTFFAGVQQMPAGQYMSVDMRQFSEGFYSYYDLQSALQKQSRYSYEQEFQQTMKLHLRSDVRIGTCLSGGLDSSTVAATAQRLLSSGKGDRLLAVTAKSADAGNDETQYAKQVVDMCGLDWQLAYPVYEDFVKYHEENLRLQAEPVSSPSVFMQYWVMRQAKKAGIKVMLDGQGGDETLLGYERYYVCYLRNLWCSGRWRIFWHVYRDIVQHSKLNFWKLGQYFLYFSFVGIRKLVLARRLFFLKSKYLERFFRRDEGYLRQNQDLQTMQIEELTCYQLPSLLKYEDRNSMAFSIEARVPFVDHVLLEKALRLPFSDKIKDGYTKYCLRQIAAKCLPKAIAWRKNKYGFETPDKIWLERFCPAMQEKVEKSALIHQLVDTVPDIGRLSLGLRWRLYNLAIWERQYLQEKCQ